MKGLCNRGSFRKVTRSVTNVSGQAPEARESNLSIPRTKEQDHVFGCPE
jgi:hypothetical protein